MNGQEESRAVPTEHAGEPKVEFDVKEVLLRKRETLLRELKEVNTAILQLRGEYNRRLKQLLAQKQPSEEALQHLEALLRIEGAKLDNSQDATEGNMAATVLTGTAFALDAAFRLLEHVHRPMHYRAIASKLQEQHIFIPGKDPAATLLSGFIRDARFKRTRKRGTYTLSGLKVRTTKSKHGKRTVKRKPRR